MCGNHIVCEGGTIDAGGSPPRVREPPMICMCDRCGMGSPPRVREPQDGSWLELWRPGITPACAGTTRTPSCRPCLCRDHPRVCGNHSRRRRSGRSRRDHPRVCGNHTVQMALSVFQKGSPPRVREPPPRTYQRAVRARITPACAGTTSGNRPGKP